MEITMRGDTITFSEDLQGKIALERQQFNGEADKKIPLENLYRGCRIMTIPRDLKPGLYDVYADDRRIYQGLYIGKKPIVKQSVEVYCKYENKGLFRHKIEFGEFQVQPGKENDFFLECGGRELVLPTAARSEHFDFLFWAERIDLRLSEELQRFIELR